MKTKLPRLILSSFAAFALIGLTVCNPDRKSSELPYPTLNKKSDTEVFVYPVSETGYGYEIIVNGQSYIQQDFIPAIQGRIPFASYEDAEKTGKLVVKKLSNQESPSIRKEELKELGIIE